MPAAQFKWWLLTTWIDLEDGNTWDGHPIDNFYEHPDLFDYGKGQMEECPESLRRHWQWILHTKKKMTAVALQDALAGVNWVIGMRKNQADEYVHKEDTSLGHQFEHGKRPFHSDQSEDWDAQLELYRTHQFEQMNTRVFVLHGSNFERAISTMVRPISGPKEVIVITGPKDTGKSRQVWTLNCGPNIYDTDKIYPLWNYQWWDGYTGQEILLVEEYMGQWPIDFLLKLLDRYPLRVPRKGSSVWLRLRKIYFTSNLPLEEWYVLDSNGPNGITPLQLEALKRRITHNVAY